jgi:hypothetical protein
LAKDIDGNGSLDAMVFCYMKAEDGKMKPFPMSTKGDLEGQVVSMRKKFPTYKAYGAATMDDIWNAKDKEDALMLQANYMASSYIENKGDGHFEIKPLPLETQAAPVFGMMSEDIDGDGNIDILITGNDFGMDPYTGRNDAFNGLCLKGDGKGNFQPLSIAQSGFFVPGDAKALAKIHDAKNEDLYVATQNQDSVMVYAKLTNNKKNKWINLQPEDFTADIIYKNGNKKHTEFYYGSTYLSQSSRKFKLTEDVNKIIITNFKGAEREVINK